MRDASIPSLNLTEPIPISTIRVDGLCRIQIGDDIHIVYYAKTPVITEGLMVIENQIVARVVWPNELWVAQIAHMRKDVFLIEPEYRLHS